LPAGSGSGETLPELAKVIVHETCTSGAIYQGEDESPADKASTAGRMREALAPRGAGLAGEPPVGACIVRDGRVIATAHTAVIAGPDATAHAEMLALRAACRHARTATLAGCELFVTVEPCAMCLAASHYAGIERIWFGVGLSAMQAVTGRELRGAVPPGLVISGGILADECGALLNSWAAGRGRRR
jgi:tRNA(adenine34) deaminase